MKYNEVLLGDRTARAVLHLQNLLYLSVSGPSAL